MAITILPPVVEDVDALHASDYDVAMSMDSESDGGISRPVKRSHLAGIGKIGTGIVTPGEVVTDDPQWMRLVYLFNFFLSTYSEPSCFEDLVLSFSRNLLSAS